MVRSSLRGAGRQYQFRAALRASSMHATMLDPVEISTRLKEELAITGEE
jgi:hypothetical protein